MPGDHSSDQPVHFVEKSERGAITDVAGLKVGHFTDTRRPTGCTVILAEEGAVAGVDVRGAAPGTRETDLLRPGMLSLGEIEQAAVPEGSHPAPGMHERHYSPRTPLYLVKGPDELPPGLGFYVWREKTARLQPHFHMPAEPATREHRRIIAFRNILIHGYADVDHLLVWDII